MEQTIIIQFIKSAIRDNVKSETYLRGQVVKGADQKAAGEVYHEQAGNDPYQERLLDRGFRTNLSTLKTHLSEYLISSGQSSADNISETETGDIVTLTLTVSDRFNKSNTDPLAKLCSKYIEDCMLMDWYRSYDKERASIYQTYSEKGLQDIKRCFNKIAPAAPTVPYTNNINIVGDEFEMEVGEECTVTYAIDGGCVDDIEIRIDDPHICTVGRIKEGFTVKGNHQGHTGATLYSRHNEEVAERVHIFVIDAY